MNPELNKKYEESAWYVATAAIETCIRIGKIDEAKRQARLAIENWKEEGKTEVIGQFTEWLRTKGILLDAE